MYTVDLLAVGRGQNVVDAARNYLDELGFRFRGTTLDAEALEILDGQRVRVLVIGGGVEDESVALLTARAHERGTTVVRAQRTGRGIEQYLAEEVVPLLRD